MKAIVALSVFVLLFVATCSAAVDYPSSEEYLQQLSKKASFEVGINKNFLGHSIEDVKSMLGWIKEKERKNLDLSPLAKSGALPSAVPENFTASQHWPRCPTIGTIWNQARCGSCWAFGGVAAASDRFCIASNARIHGIYSFAAVTECSDEANGCEGGSASATWDYIQSPGIPTLSCYPYNIPTCPPAQQPCLNFVSTPSCWYNQSCADGTNWDKDLKTVSSVYGLNSVQDAQNDIYRYGPIEACFDVYEDLLHYKKGVYIYDGTSSYLGGHCVKISGWGVEGGVKYWLVNNSWTTAWGDRGYFKIQRGTDMCGIEDDLVAGLPSTM